jgi:hypothetical protein
MKESIHLFLLCAFYLVCLLITVMYPLGELESFLIWAIGISHLYHGSPRTLHAAAPGEWIGGIGRL